MTETPYGTSVYGGCRDGAQVISYDVIGAGHVWPDGPQYLPPAIIGKTSRNLDASQVIGSSSRAIISEAFLGRR